MTGMLDSSPTLQRTAEQVFSVPGLREKLDSGRPLRIKYGVDVTAPFLHTGHAVNLWAMRELQEAGHQVMLLIGDFTTRIGDPTGKSRTRPVIPQEQINRDAAGFISQASRVLLTDPAVFEVRRNSEWWSPMPLQRFMELLSLATHARLIQRDMFQRRIARATGAGEVNPMAAKRRLGRALVERYYDAAAAAAEDDWFTEVFSRRGIPEDVPVVGLADAGATLIEVLRACLPAESASALRRLVRDGAVRVDGGDKLDDADQRHPVADGAVLRVGRRRWFRITFPD